jgi:hypothetical protein
VQYPEAAGKKEQSQPSSVAVEILTGRAGRAGEAANVVGAGRASGAGIVLALVDIWGEGEGNDARAQQHEKRTIPAVKRRTDPAATTGTTGNSQQSPHSLRQTLKVSRQLHSAVPCVSVIEMEPYESRNATRMRARDTDTKHARNQHEMKLVRIARSIVMNDE